MVRYGTTGVALLVLLLAGLGFFRTIRKGMAVEIPAAELEAAGARSAVSGASRSALPAGLVPGQRGADDSEVLALVDERPDDVAALLRGWLAECGSDR